MNKRFLNSPAGQVIIIGAAVALGVYVVEKRARGVVSSIDPTNANNVFAGGVNNVGAIVSDNEHWTLGGWLHDVINGTHEQQAGFENVQTGVMP